MNSDLYNWCTSISCVPSNLDIDLDYDIQLIKRVDPIIYFLEIDNKVEYPNLTSKEFETLAGLVESFYNIDKGVILEIYNNLVKNG